MKHVILYVPVIHQGYLRFLESEAPDTLWIIGPDLAEHLDPCLRKDIRRISPVDAATSLKYTLLDNSLEICYANGIDDLKRIPTSASVVLPTDDLSEKIASLLPNHTVSMSAAFLRWDRTRVHSHAPALYHAQITSESSDAAFMNSAATAALRATDCWRGVGAILVCNDQIVASAHNTHKPYEHTPQQLGDVLLYRDTGDSPWHNTVLHAEMGVLLSAARQGISTRGADLYVTTFPCASCAQAIVAAGISRVYFRDGHSTLNGGDVLIAGGVALFQVVE